MPLATLAVLFWLWQRAQSPREAASGRPGIRHRALRRRHLLDFPRPRDLRRVAGCRDPGHAGIGRLSVLLPGTGRLGRRATCAVPTHRRGLSLPRPPGRLAEWLRGTMLTGYGWLAVGYSQLLPEVALPVARLRTRRRRVPGVVRARDVRRAYRDHDRRYRHRTCASGSRMCCGHRAGVRRRRVHCTFRVDATCRRAARRVAGPGQRRAAPEVRPRVPHTQFRDVRRDW